MKLSEVDVGELIQSLNDLDVEDLKKIGTAPKPVKIGAIILV